MCFGAWTGMIGFGHSAFGIPSFACLVFPPFCIKMKLSTFAAHVRKMSWVVVRGRVESDNELRPAPATLNNKPILI
jgi:hypothetical protein